MAERIELGFPFKGLHQGSPGDDMPPGTTVGPLVNWLPRDPRASYVRRASAREGLDRPDPSDATAENLPVQGVIATFVNPGDSLITVGAAALTDNFTTADTLYSDVDPIGSAYTIDATYGWDQTTLFQGRLADVRTRSGSFTADDEGPNIDSNTVVDGMDSTAAGNFSGNYVKCWLCQHETADPATSEYAVELKFTTGAAYGASDVSLVGFVVGINRASMGTSFKLACGLKIGTDGKFTALVAYIPGAGTLAAPDGFTLTSNYYDDKATALATGTAYQIQFRVSGRRGEFYYKASASSDWILLWSATDLQTAFNGSTAYYTRTFAGDGVGFVIGGVGASRNVASVDDFKLLAASGAASLITSPKIVKVAGGDVSVADRNEDTGRFTFATATDGADSVNPNVHDVCLFLGLGQTATSSGGDYDTSVSGDVYAYLLDGFSYNRVNLRTETVSAWAASPGDLPTGSTRVSRYGVLWQDRAVLFGLDNFPDNWFMSRRGNLDDFDYTPTTRDGYEAIAGHVTGFGPGLFPGRALSCVAPFDDDTALFSSREQIWLMVGNPADGGVFSTLTDRNGIVGPYATARDAMGNMFLLGLSGLYFIPYSGGKPEPLSMGRLDGFFENVDFTRVSARLIYDRDADWLHILLHDPMSSDPQTHLVWDRRENAAFPVEYAFPHGPSAACVYADPAARKKDVILLGGRDGQVRRLCTATDDDGLGIDGVFSTPAVIGSGGLDRATIEGIECKLARTTDTATWEIARADNGSDLATAAAYGSGELYAARTAQLINRRVGGGAVHARVRLTGVAGEVCAVDRFAVRATRSGRLEPSTRG